MYYETWRTNCTAKHDLALDHYRLPNMLNRSAVPLNLTTFMQMYMASQLLQQVDFGFRGVQQYYYKSPGSLNLSTGPPYDFDGPWDVCATDTVDVVTCHGTHPSPLWKHLGRHASSSHPTRRTGGLEILDRDVTALRTLYATRRTMYAEGYFSRHESRWSMSGRVKGDYGRHLIALSREHVIPPRRHTIDEEH